jgi:peptidoglycan/LPS O-acetylase OafA/YrhL
MRPSDQRLDNFDLLRLIAAFLVLWSHQQAILGYREPDVPLINGQLGAFGVLIFFGLSGYLNALSLLRRRSTTDFLIARAFRIYPALIICILLTVILGAAITTDPANYYGIKTLRYLLQNATLVGIQVRLPGVFNTNSYPDAVNNSIWTLPIEAACYIGLALVGYIARFRARTMLYLLYGIAAVLLLFSAFVRHLTADWLVALDHVPRYYGASFLGGALFAVGEKVKGHWYSATLLFAVSAAFLVAGQHLTATLILLSATVVTIGKMPLMPWMRPPIDISYGTYLYAFPIQQLIAGYGFNYWTSSALSIAFAPLLGLLSAVVVEGPALSRKRRRDTTSRNADVENGMIDDRPPVDQSIVQAHAPIETTMRAM